MASSIVLTYKELVEEEEFEDALGGERNVLGLVKDAATNAGCSFEVRSQNDDVVVAFTGTQRQLEALLHDLTDGNYEEEDDDEEFMALCDRLIKEEE